MEISVLIIGSVFAISLVLPFILAARSRKKTLSAIERRFNSICATEGLSVTVHDVINSKVIGVDENGQKLIFVSLGKGNDNYQVISLEKIYNTEKVIRSRQIGTGKNQYQVIDSIALKIYTSEGAGMPVLLEIYNADENMELTGEVQAVEKWLSLIRKYIHRPQAKIIA